MGLERVVEREASRCRRGRCEGREVVGAGYNCRGRGLEAMTLSEDENILLTVTSEGASCCRLLKGDRAEHYFLAADELKYQSAVPPSRILVPLQQSGCCNLRCEAIVTNGKH